MGVELAGVLLEVSYDGVEPECGVWPEGSGEAGHGGSGDGLRRHSADGDHGELGDRSGGVSGEQVVCGMRGRSVAPAAGLELVGVQGQVREEPVSLEAGSPSGYEGGGMAIVAS